MEISKDIKHVGVNDHDIDLFEGQYDVPNGMAYNSYVVLDSNVAVFDTVDERFAEEWLKNIKDVLGAVYLEKALTDRFTLSAGVHSFGSTKDWVINGNLVGRIN